MPDQPVPVPYPNTPATTIRPVDPDLQPPHTQTTHPSTTAHDPEPNASKQQNGEGS